ncbi:MAG TPA: VOC family protein [Actinomycetota bacterium]|nr:VOC family protein [Actinomycetota bacterium]
MIDRIDHLVLTVASLETTCRFYTECLDFDRVDSSNGPTALRFGQQKINVHQAEHTFRPRAQRPTEGSADFCLIAAVPLSDVVDRLARHDVAVELGPVERHGALGPMESIYFRDPDGNLIEVSRYHDRSGS